MGRKNVPEDTGCRTASGSRIYAGFFSQCRHNIIQDESISKWRLDCLHVASKEDAIDMVIRHYSCVGDTITMFTKTIGEKKSITGRFNIEALANQI